MYYNNNGKYKANSFVANNLFCSANDPHTIVKEFE